MLLALLLDTNVLLSAGPTWHSEDLTVADGTRYTAEGWFPVSAEAGGRLRFNRILLSADYSFSPYALWRTDSNTTTQHFQQRLTAGINWRHEWSPLWAIALGPRGLFEWVPGLTQTNPADPRDTGRSLWGIGLGLTSATRLGPGALEADAFFLPLLSSSPRANWKTGWQATLAYHLPLVGLEWGLRLQTAGKGGEQLSEMQHGVGLSLRWSPATE